MAQSATGNGSDIAQLWAAELQRARQKLLSASEGCNRMYESRILRGGDSVRINMVNDITVNSSHSRSADMTLQTLRTTDMTLVIDAEDDYAFYVDDVDQQQMAADIMPEAMARAAYKLRDTMDQYIFTTMSGSVNATNVLTAATVGTGASDSDLYEILVDIDEALDNVDAPSENRFCFLPPFGAALIRKDPRRVSFGTSENLTTYGSGYIGKSIGGMDIFITRNLPTTAGVVTVLAGTRDATTLAEQMSKAEANRHPTRFGDIHKGLHVYGAKVVRPDELVSIALTKAT